MFSVVNVFLPSGPMLPLHQSQAERPARIQEVSLTTDSGFRLVITLDSISRPGSEATSNTLQGEWCGSVPITEISGSVTLGAILDSNQCPVQLPEGFTRYIAA